MMMISRLTAFMPLFWVMTCEILMWLFSVRDHNQLSLKIQKALKKTRKIINRNV